MNELLKECRRALEGAAEMVEDHMGTVGSQSIRATISKIDVFLKSDAEIRGLLGPFVPPKAWPNPRPGLHPMFRA